MVGATICKHCKSDLKAPLPWKNGAKRKDGKISYNEVVDKVGLLPNVNKRDNMIQGIAVAVCAGIGGLIGLFAGGWPEGAGLGATMSQLHAGDFAPVLKQAANTSKASSTLVAKSSAEFWQRSQLMALRCDSSSGFIFLNAPGVPWMFSCLYFEKQSGNMGLSNIEILDFPVQDAFKGVNQ